MKKVIGTIIMVIVMFITTTASCEKPRDYETFEKFKESIGVCNETIIAREDLQYAISHSSEKCVVAMLRNLWNLEEDEKVLLLKIEENVVAVLVYNVKDDFVQNMDKDIIRLIMMEII